MAELSQEAKVALQSPAIDQENGDERQRSAIKGQNEEASGEVPGSQGA